MWIVDEASQFEIIATEEQPSSDKSSGEQRLWFCAPSACPYLANLNPDQRQAVEHEREVHPALQAADAERTMLLVLLAEEMAKLIELERGKSC
jgi:hypothetical protein